MDKTKAIKGSSYFKIFLLLTLLYLGFQTKPWTNVIGGIYAGDDNSYYGYTSSIVNDFDLDLSNNEVAGDADISPLTGKMISPHSIGTAVFLIPFYIAAKPLVLISNWITNTPFNQRHALFFMFMCSGILLYAYIGGYFLYRTCLLLGFNKQISLISVMAIIWGTILPAYIFKRPIFPCVPEFFLISSLLYIITKLKGNSSIQFKHVLAIGLVSGGILITRWNDIPVVLFATYYLLAQRLRLSERVNSRIFKLLLFLIIVFAVFFLTQCLAWKYFSGSYFKLPYNPYTAVAQSSKTLSITSIFIHIFIGLDWGIIYTMLPFVIGSLSFLWLNPLTISKRYYFDRIVYFTLFLIPFIVIFKYKQQGSYYGYRYLLSLLPFACLGLAAFIDRIHKRFPGSLKYFNLFLYIVIFLNFFIILPFEYDQSTTLAEGYSIMGGRGWVNDYYVLNAVKIYFISPIVTLIGLFSRGFVGGYIFGGIYLFFPDIFAKIAQMNSKISFYYAINSYDKWFAIFYPFLAILVLTVFRSLMKKID